MDRANLKKLIARVGAAEGPSRTLDAEIAAAVGWEKSPIWDCDWWTPQQAAQSRNNKQALNLCGNPQPLPCFSKSLDVALSLVPKGHTWALHINRDAGGFNACCLNGGAMLWYRGSTPPLAICVAALSASLAIIDWHEAAQIILAARKRMAGGGDECAPHPPAPEPREGLQPATQRVQTDRAAEFFAEAVQRRFDLPP